MGQGYTLHCPKCNYELRYQQGVGFMGGMEAKKILSEIKNGKHGKEFKEVFKTAKVPKVQHSRELYKCGKCGKLRQDMLIQLYDKEKLLMTSKCKCKKCNSNMTVVKDVFNIKCPKCDEMLEITDLLHWD